MQTKHTPGPWKYSTNVGPTRALIVEPDGSTIVEIFNRTQDSRFEANVRIMTAAPALLAALELLTSIAQEQRDKRLPGDWVIRQADIDNAKAAIAAATGKREDAA